MFFAYIGFDAVTTTAQEAKNPKRDMPIGILGSLAICTVLYLAVGLVLTGIVSYDRLNVADPMPGGRAPTVHVTKRSPGVPAPNQRQGPLLFAPCKRQKKAAPAGDGGQSRDEDDAILTTEAVRREWLGRN